MCAFVCDSVSPVGGAVAVARAVRMESAEGASVPSSKRAKTTPDAMTRAWFAETATSVELVVGGHKAELPVKAFRTGSSGWFVNTKLPFTVGSEEVRVSVQCCCIVVDSKRWSDA